VRAIEALYCTCRVIDHGLPQLTYRFAHS
jgi:hypothetical protein